VGLIDENRLSVGRAPTEDCGESGLSWERTIMVLGHRVEATTIDTLAERPPTIGESIPITLKLFA
jgi:hypothetical protein